MPFAPDYDVTPDRRAYTLHAGPTGCLMLHGFMGSPISSRPMAEFLAEQGVTVHCPLLPGHGELPEKIKGVRREAWLAEAEEGLEVLRQECDEIFLMGHSMGTVLCAHLASRHADIRGMVMLAPLYQVPSRLIHATRLLRYVVPWFYPWRFRRLRPLTRQRVMDLYPDLDLSDPEVQAWLPQASRVPTDAVDEMRKMADYGRSLWPILSLPALVLQGDDDIAVDAANTDALFATLGSEAKELYHFPEAGHELMRPSDPTHEEVWPLALQFVREQTVNTALAHL